MNSEHIAAGTIEESIHVHVHIYSGLSQCFTPELWSEVNIMFQRPSFLNLNIPSCILCFYTSFILSKKGFCLQQNFQNIYITESNNYYIFETFM